MIRVKLLSEPDYRALLCKPGAFRAYEERQFYDLLREKGDFTDAESLALLRHLHEVQDLSCIRKRGGREKRPH